jgi:hypothetical protein
VSGVFQNIDPPPPLHPAMVSSPRNKGGGVHTRRAVRVNILEDARHCIGLLQYNLSRESVSLLIFLQQNRPLRGEERGGGVPKSRGEPHLQRRVALPALARTGRGRAARSRTAFPGQTRPVPHGFDRPARALLMYKPTTCYVYFIF